MLYAICFRSKTTLGIYDDDRNEDHGEIKRRPYSVLKTSKLYRKHDYISPSGMTTANPN